MTRRSASRGSPRPSPAEIREARARAGLTQAAAAALVHRTVRNWQQWELGERSIDPAAWALFRVRAGGRAP